MTEEQQQHRKLAAIMFTDMVGYSALAQRDEALSLALLEEHQRMLRPIFPKFGGTEISTIGDAFLVEFESALDALLCAVDVQRTLADRNAQRPAPEPILVRIGIHVGDIVHTGGNVLGDGVNIAARLQPIAEPGGICFSQDVARFVENQSPYPLRRLGHKRLKNIARPVAVFALDLPWIGAVQAASLRRPSRLRWYVPAAFALLALAFWLLWPRLFPHADVGRYRLGIVPFQNPMHDSTVAEWPSFIQSLLVGELTGVEDIAVLHDLSLNNLMQSAFGTVDPKRDKKYYDAVNATKPNLIIDGSIVRLTAGYSLEMKLIDPITGEIKYSSIAKCADENGLQEAVHTLAGEALSWIDNKVFDRHKDRNLAPFFTSGNMRALSKFMEASRYVYRFNPDAEQYLRETLALDSTFISPRVWLISALIKRNDTAEARRQLAVLHRLEPKANPFEQAMIGYAGAFVNRDEGAQMRYLSVALDYSPRNNILIFLLARMRFIHNDFQGCADALRDVLATHWEYSPAYYLAAIAQHQLHRDDEASRMLQNAEDIVPVYPDIHLLKMVIHRRAGDTLRAQQDEDRYVTACGEFGRSADMAYETIAEALLEEKSYASAVSSFRLAAELKPRNASYRERYGDALFLAGDTLRGVKEMRRAIALDASIAPAHLRLGNILEARGDLKSAKAEYRKFLSLDPQSPDAIALRRRLPDIQQ